MPKFAFEQPLRQLPKRQGGYYYLHIDADIVNQFEKKRATRLVLSIDQTVSYSCGLNHLGDGNFFLIVATRYVKKLGKEAGDLVSFTIEEDPNPLGVAVPEVLEVLLSQDASAKEVYDSLTDGKKRSLIYSIQRVKSIDLQVEKILEFLEEQRRKRK